MEEINIKELFNYFLSKILILITIVLTILIFGNIYSLFIKTPLYKSTTTLVLVSEDSTITQSDVTLNNNLVGTYKEIIKSKNVLNKVIENLNLTYTNNTLANKISVSNVTNTQIIKISVSDVDSNNAKIIADELAEVFIEETGKIYKLNNIAVVDAGSLEVTPYNMNIIKENIIYLFIGLALSGIVILVMFTLDTSINNSEDVEEKLGLTVLGNVPKVGDIK